VNPLLCAIASSPSPTRGEGEINPTPTTATTRLSLIVAPAVIPDPASHPLNPPPTPGKISDSYFAVSRRSGAVR